MGHIEGASRDQQRLCPEVLEDDLAEDHPVRCIDAVVDRLDRTALGCRRAQPASVGRPSDHPGSHLKRYIYGYLNRIRCSRRLARATQRNVERLWLSTATAARCQDDRRRSQRQRERLQTGISCVSSPLWRSQPQAQFSRSLALNRSAAIWLLMHFCAFLGRARLALR
jgi:transposase